MSTYESPIYPQSEEEEEQDQPTRRRCRHIFTAGRRCGSPCLRTEQFCYYHHTARKPIPNPADRLARASIYDLPDPEDRDAIRSSIARIMHAIAHNAIDIKRAGMLLYSLQISLCSLPPQPRPAPVVATKPNPLNNIVEYTVLDETHGVIAPEEEYEEPEELKPRRSLARQLLDEVERYEARQAAEKEAEDEARRLQDIEETQEELRRCQAAREAANAATEPGAQPPTEVNVQPPAKAGVPHPASETRDPPPHRPAAIDLRAAAENTRQKKCHPERSLARICARRCRRIRGPIARDESKNPGAAQSHRRAHPRHHQNLSPAKDSRFPPLLRARPQPCHNRAFALRLQPLRYASYRREDFLALLTFRMGFGINWPSGRRSGPRTVRSRSSAGGL